MAEVAAMFTDTTVRAMAELWHEFEAAETPEAKFALGPGSPGGPVSAQSRADRDLGIC